MAIIALGSILEGALKATLKRFPGAANQASRTPKDKASGKPKLFRDWTFRDLIQVAEELGWIGAEVRRMGHDLREYRNLVHPAEQVHLQEFPTQNSARLCRQAVLAALASLMQWLESRATP